MAVTACLNTMLRKGASFKWTEQCGNAFRLLKSELVKMPRLQYPKLEEPFMLFTDASKHSYSGILYQEETSHHLGAEVNPIPIRYFSGLFGRTQQLWNTIQKECYAAFRSIQKFAFYLAGTKCTLYCDHKPLAPFFTTGMSSLMLDRWDLELQQFEISSSSTFRVRKMWLQMLYPDCEHLVCIKTMRIYHPHLKMLWRILLKRSSPQTQPQPSKPIMWGNLIRRY